MQTYNDHYRVLVIKPPYQYIPIGIAYVLSCLKQADIHFDFFDLHRIPNIDWHSMFTQAEYLAVTTGGLVGDFKDIQTICSHSKTYLPETPLILGGGITHDLSDDLLFKHLGIDFLIRGEAETSLPELLKAIIRGSTDFRNCRGLIYKDKADGNLIKKPACRLNLISEDTLPAYDEIDILYYMNSWKHSTFGKFRAIPILTGRGCKGRCSFCSPTMGKFRARRIENILREILVYQKKYNPEIFVFLNEIMFETEDQILLFCNEYSKIPDAKPWICLLRADLDPSILYPMKQAGCFGLNIGVESGSDKILKRMNKGTNVSQISKFIRAAQDAGIIVEASAILGCEGESEEDIRATIDFYINEKILHPAIQFTVAYPGTRIYKNALKNGLVQDEWQYLQKLSFGLGPNDPTVCCNNYLNISQIPDDDFWRTQFREYIRYTHYLYEQCAAKNMHRTYIAADTTQITGQCPACNCNIEISVQSYGYKCNNFLHIHHSCPQCKTKVFFNPFVLEGLQSHADNLNQHLMRAKRPLIYGANENAVALFLYGILDLPLDRLIGFVDPCRDTKQDKFFFFPRLSVNQISELAPDFILDVESFNSHLGFFENSSQQLPHVENLLPKNFYMKNITQSSE